MRKAYKFPDRTVFVGFKFYIQKVVPVMLMRLSMTWFSNVMLMIGAGFSTIQAAAIGVIQGLMPLYSMFTIGINMGMMISVSRFIGAGNSSAAKRMTNNLILEYLVISVFMGITFFFLRFDIVKLYTSYEDVQEYAEKLLAGTY